MYKKLLRNVNTDDWASFRCNLVIAIRDRLINKQQLTELLNIIKDTSYYMEHANDTLIFDANTDENSWDDNYIERISIAIICGDISDDTIMHMFNVSRKVHYKNKKSIPNTIKKIVIGISVITLVGGYYWIKR